LRIDLPTPPTVNHAYAVVRGRKILSKAGRDYKADVATRLLLARWRPLGGEVVWSLWWRRDRKSGDISNRIKLVEDAMKGIAWADDAQVVELHAYRSDEGEPGITVEVLPA